MALNLYRAWGMRALLAAVLLVASIEVCNKRSTPGSVADPQDWFIESFDSGIITVQHEGNTYKATCDSSRSFNNAGSVTDRNNVVEFTACDMAIGLVGHTVQRFEGKQRSADGAIVNMWSVGSILALRSWRDERTPWRQEEFKITSVTKKSDLK